MPSRRRILVMAAGAIVLPVILWCLVSWVKPVAMPVDVAVARPVWTVSLTGSPGELAAVWVWTPRGSLLTNLNLPAELRLDSSFLLVQASNRPSQPMKMKVKRPDGASADVGWVTTTNQVTTFVSTMSRLVPGMGGFGATVAPFGSRPVFEHPLALNHSGFEPAPEFTEAASR